MLSKLTVLIFLLAASAHAQPPSVGITDVQADYGRLAATAHAKTTDSQSVVWMTLDDGARTTETAKSGIVLVDGGDSVRLWFRGLPLRGGTYTLRAYLSDGLSTRTVTAETAAQLPDVLDVLRTPRNFEGGRVGESINKAVAATGINENKFRETLRLLIKFMANSQADALEADTSIIESRKRQADVLRIEGQ